MSDTTDQALLGQILSEVRATRGDLSNVQVQVAQVVVELKQQARAKDDHETRIRALEESVRQEDVDAAAYVTKADLAESDRTRTARFRWLLTASLTIFGLVETAVIALIVKG